MKKEVIIAVFVLFLANLCTLALGAGIYTADSEGNLKNDFSPEETVYIHGAGFSGSVLISVTRPDKHVDIDVSGVDFSGNFVYAYVLDGIKGSYSVYASDGRDNDAWAFFTDAAIWTTLNDCGDSSQDVNHYKINDSVYINGAGFNSGAYNWEIRGKPGGASCDPNLIVASGNKPVNSSGDFCFKAYKVKDDDCGEYQVKFGVKGDNYRIIGSSCVNNSECGVENSRLECRGNNISNVTETPTCLNGKCNLTITETFFRECGKESSRLVCVGKNLTNITVIPSCSNGACINSTIIHVIETCEIDCSNEHCIKGCINDSECPSDSFIDYCKNNDVYRNLTDNFCRNNMCLFDFSSILKKDCGNDYCESWGKNYCRGNASYKNKTCYDKGCSNGACFNNSIFNETFIEDCENGCFNGECISSECGNGKIEFGEQCELPFSVNNIFCNQTGNACLGNKIGKRDLLGNCDSRCSCDYDNFVYSCEKNSCGAECSDDSDCPETGCENKCIGKDYYEYGADENKCLNCLCEKNSCKVKKIIKNDVRCDVDEFCKQFYCAPDCFDADWLGNENSTSPYDCTVVLVNREGDYYPKCVSTTCAD